MASDGDKETRRKEFLFHMYDQMFNDINRHINVIWQPITVLIGSFALLAAGMRDILQIDIAISLIILLAGWLLANLYDSSYWYNRNLVIIANIERQFLKQSDLKEIQYYFGKHRSAHAMIRHIRIQWWLGVFTGGTILLFHLFSEALKSFPDFSKIASEFHLSLIIPYIVAVIVAIWLNSFKNNREHSYAEFIKNSPGIELDTSNVEYGIGHPIEKGEKSSKTGSDKKS
jgi:hypothetical protein